MSPDRTRARRAGTTGSDGGFGEAPLSTSARRSPARTVPPRARHRRALHAPRVCTARWRAEQEATGELRAEARLQAAIAPGVPRARSSRGDRDFVAVVAAFRPLGRRDHDGHVRAVQVASITSWDGPARVYAQSSQGARRRRQRASSEAASAPPSRNWAQALPNSRMYQRSTMDVVTTPVSSL